MDYGSLLLFWVLFAGVVGLAAHARGRSGIGWFFIGVLVSPVLALIAVLVMQNLNDGSVDSLPRGEDRRRSAPIRAGTTTDPVGEARKPCPDCGEMVPLAARICRFCRYEFQTSVADRPPVPKGPTCPRCGGSGTITSYGREITCPNCHGSGIQPG